VDTKKIVFPKNPKIKIQTQKFGNKIKGFGIWNLKIGI
jgi:hypothetical protein